MDVFFDFCNICYKIDGSLKDISEDNLKHLKDTLIALVGNADIIKHNEIYLCKLCCEELIRFDKFKEKCFNMLSKLVLKDDMATAKNTLKKYVHEQILPRNYLGINNCPVSIPTEYGIVKLSEHFNKNDAVFNRQVINLQSERNESEYVSDCTAVSVINSASEYDESQVALTNEQDMKNGIRCSEYNELETFDRKFHEDFQASDINNANVNNTSHTQLIKEEVDLDNEIESSDSENVTLPNFEHINVDVNVSTVNNGEETVNSTKDELHVKKENSTSDVEMETIQDEFGDGLNRNQEPNVGMKLQDTSSAAIINSPSSGTHEREYGNGRSPTALQSDVHARAYPDAGPHTCAVCNQSFRTNSFLFRHYCTHINARPHKCTVCNKTFSRPSDLAKHERIHSGDRPYKCPVCNKAFIESSGLAKHKRIHSGDRPYKCSVCNKAFTESPALTRHKRTHTDNRPYKCSVCNKAFRQLGSLITHERIHSGDKPYKCNVCDKAFAQPCSLVVHERTHTGERPYKCTDCNKAFGTAWNLESHKRTHSGDRPYKCNVCFKAFKQSGSLIVHKHTHQ